MSVVPGSLAVAARKLAPLLRLLLTPLDNIVYASPTGSATASGKDAAHPVTLEEAFRRLAAGWTRYGVLFLAAGTYSWPSPVPMTIPGGSGAGAYPLQIIGAWVDSGEGELVATGATAAAATTGAIFTVAGKAWTTDQWRGARLRYTGGSSSWALLKKSILIGTNTATDLQLPPSISSAAAGDTAVIETMGSIIDFGPLATHSPSIVAGTGNVVCLRGVRLQTTVIIQVIGLNVLVEGLLTEPRAGGTTGGVTMRNCMVMNMALSGTWRAKTSGADVIAYNSPVAEDLGWCAKGPAAGSIYSMQASIALLRSSVFDNVSLSGSHSYFAPNNCFFRGRSSVLVIASSRTTMFNCNFDAVVPNAVGGVVSASDGGYAELNGVAISNTASGVPIFLINGSKANLTGVVGSGNVGVPLTLRWRSGARATGCTVTGTTPGLDVQVGGAAAAISWATAQTTNGNTDVAAGNTQLCSVSL